MNDVINIRTFLKKRKKERKRVVLIMNLGHDYLPIIGMKITRIHIN